ncbi:MAG: hypothetical protein LBD17_00950 [Endomicrobium sp.]|jgi:hypothetical protein|nr:hypothetical protein [Endomicrobium sp.]
MLKERSILCESLGKICLFSAVLCSTFVLARTFLKNEDKAAKRYAKRLRTAYDGLSPQDYSDSESTKVKLTGKL